LKTAAPIEVPLYLYQAQMRSNTLWDVVFSLIDKKHGWTRANVLGGMFNYTTRCVIVLDPTLKLDEVDISYRSFVTVYSGLIIKEIMKDRGWTITRSYNYLKSKFVYDDYVYMIIQRVLQKYQPPIIVNRNPTITLGSILMMKIRRVKRDPNDLTLAIPSGVLGGLNADFDGDALNCIGLPLEEIAEMFKGFSPTNMMIDRTTGAIKLTPSSLEGLTLYQMSAY
jgi:DNA-directed RNA polymerase beta' subunit